MATPRDATTATAKALSKPMPRILTDDPYDEHGQHRPRHRDWLDREQRADRLPRGGEAEVCWYCFRPLAARDICPICGDPEDMAA
jgi:hypothetical protein